MRWCERQLAMLEAMGVRLWLPSPGAAVRDEAAAEDIGATVLEAPSPAASAPVARAPVARAPVARAPVARAPVARITPAAMPPAGNAVEPSAVASMDWVQLRDTVAGCTACRLWEGRRRTVFGVGHPRAHWMIVGEAPGEQEDAEGEPFVGKSGQLLDNMLRAIGLSRDAAGGPEDADGAEGDPARRVYIANTVKCRPPGNRNPALDELARCEGYLIRQVELVQPKIILAMGRFAVQTLLRSSEPVGRLRGVVHRYHGVPLVVTYHPAYLLRNLEDKAKAWDDLCLALETIGAVV